MPHLLGENNHQTKLTASKVNTIRREYIPGVTTMAEVGRRHGVSRVTVAQIINGKTWRWLPDEN